jgi:hypothetical protein
VAEHERLVVVAALEHLGQEPFGSTRLS